MLNRRMRGGLLVVALVALSAWIAGNRTAQAEGRGQPYDWSRFYYYPYVYYPPNFQRPTQYDHLYYRYPQERRIPMYRTDWYNAYPSERPYHKGHHFLLDVF